MAHLSVSLLGTFQVRLESQSLTEFESDKARALLTYLMVEGDQPHQRDRLAGLLWPDWPDAHARANLRHTLNNLRTVLHNQEADPPFLLSDRQIIQFNLNSDYRLDVAEFSQALVGLAKVESSQADEQVVQGWQRAVQLYAGPFMHGFFLPGCSAFEEWLLLTRERLQLQMLVALQALALHFEQQGDYKEAQRYVRRQLELDPLQENAHAHLMRLLALTGQRSAALVQFERCQQLLAEELGVEPSPEVIGLHRQIQTGQLGRGKEAEEKGDRRVNILGERGDKESSPMPLRTSNLPTHLSKFIGREKEIIQAKAQLVEGRLVTLIGPGGIGKTRLLIQVAQELLPEYTNGVWLVELAPLVDPALVPQAVATALGVQSEPSRPLLAALTDYLRNQTVLLVLDNCEHLIEACAQLAKHLLHNCTEVRLLATSREALRVEGEILFHVPSLSLPDVRQTSLEILQHSEAVCLFIERATAALPGFALTETNAPFIVQVCRRLDGIALAIELAAARVKLLKVEQIAARLDDAFRLLTGGSRTALLRQQTLRATMDWSYNLLSNPERMVFRRLSVFAGGWTLEAAEAICAGEGVEKDDLLDLLTQLTDKSLVVVQRWPGQEARYHLLETTRQYAREKLLESDESETVRNRHLAFYLRLAEEMEVKRKTAQRMARRKQFDLENDNFRATLEWALTGENLARIEQGLRLASALKHFWHWRGYYREGLSWLERGLALSAGGAHEATLIRAKALYAAGFLAAFHLAFPKGASMARSLLEESITLYRKIDPPDKRDFAGALNVLADLYAELYIDDPTAARVLSEESVTICRGLGPSGKWELAAALFWNGHVAYVQGDYPIAQSYAEESRSLFRQVGEVWETAAPINTLGHIAVRQGDYSAAHAYYEESLRLWGEVEDRWGIAVSAVWLGNIDRILGDYGAASVRFEESLRRWREMGNRADIALSLRNLGIARLFQGDSEQAAALLMESLSLLPEATDNFTVALALAGLSGVLRVQGQEVQAARLLGAAEAANTPIRSRASSAVADQAEYDRLVAAGRAQMTEPAFLAAWTEGQAMTLDQAVAYALEVTSKFST